MSIPLRVLLGLCLILNGAGTAAAAVQMQAPHVQAHAAMAATDSRHSDTTASCHDQAEPLVAAGESGGKAPPGSPDCCKFGACQCSCIQQVQFAFAMVNAAGAAGAGPATLHALVDGHAAPAPEQQLRPPII